MRSVFGSRVCVGVFVLILVSLIVVPEYVRAADTVFFVVRHAEREAGNGDVSLSPAGTKRAEQLMETLKNLRIDAIYHTKFKRSEQTAAPLAGKLNITPEKYDDATQQWVDGVISAQQGKRVLIVGHSDTVHDIVSRLTGNTVPAIGDRFDNLFVVVISGNDKSMVHLHYGEAN